MRWQEVRTQDDADFLMRVVEQFHDWHLAAVEYDPLARAGDGSKSLARFKGDTNALVILLRYCVKGKRGEWPEIELRFYGVSRMGFESLQDPESLWECWLGKTTWGGWVLTSGSPLTEEEQNDSRSIESDFFIVADEVCWRLANGSL